MVEINDKALVRKIDWRVLPIMFLIYFLQFLDKVTLNVSEGRERREEREKKGGKKRAGSTS